VLINSKLFCFKLSLNYRSLKVF